MSKFIMNVAHDFGRLDYHSLNAFAAAARTLNFTVAARQAAMTQSGVSQQVARLEAQLGAKLFTRTGKKTRLTREGEILFEFCEAQKESLDELFENVSSETSAVCGKVRYAMPYSCLLSSHFRKFLGKKEGLGAIDPEVYLCPNELVIGKLISRQIDFGFVTRRDNTPAVHFDFFCKEEYLLVGGPRMRVDAEKQDALLGCKFVDYPGMNVLFDIWAGHHFGRKALSFRSLRVGGFIDSLHGAITMLRHDVGLAVIPRHCVADHLKDGTLRVFPGRNKRPLLNDVHLVTLAGITSPARVRAVMDVFRGMGQ